MLRRVALVGNIPEDEIFMISCSLADILQLFGEHTASVNSAKMKAQGGRCLADIPKANGYSI
jgi:hypothetical protein